ncbi:MAG: hypothetical protein WKF57_21615 [Nakamurella sp.]
MSSPSFSAAVVADGAATGSVSGSAGVSAIGLVTTLGVAPAVEGRDR